MFVVLATAIIAFELPFLFEKADEMSSAQRWVFFASLLLFLASITLGCYTAWNRLKDFRKTEQKVKLRREAKDAEGERLEKLKVEIRALEDETNRLGKTTWRLLHLQTILFSLGIGSLVIAGSIFLFPNKDCGCNSQFHPPQPGVDKVRLIKEARVLPEPDGGWTLPAF